MNTYGASASREKFKKSTLACIIAGLIGSVVPVSVFADSSDCISVSNAQYVCKGETGLLYRNAAELLNPWESVVIETTGRGSDTPGSLDGRAINFVISPIRSSP